jgi:hypothetical protein
MADPKDWQQESEKDERAARRPGTGAGVSGGSPSISETDTQPTSQPRPGSSGSGGSTRGMSSGWNPATEDGNNSGSGSGGEGESDMEEEPIGSSQGTNG